ncbi:MAG: DUF2007 domain-containing protein [Verrucomicrobiales bacterium]|nr:DUF2007 domain-containing protein [Verrucomicrobiales bacterium]
MKKLRTYSKSEDAYLAASILGSIGIDAFVVDDNAFGGNLLGTLQKSAIRIEVSEDQFEKADAILEDAERKLKAPETEVVAESLPEKKRSAVFDCLVVAALLTLLSFAMWPDVFFPEPGEAFASWLADSAYSDKLWEVVHECYPGYLFLCCLSASLLLMRLHIGRILFVGVSLYSLFSMLCLPAEVSSPLGSFAGGLSWMLTGAVLVLCWTAPVAGEFRKRLRG